MKPITRIVKKAVEFIGCLACLGIKFWTDIEARRVFYTRQKYSREWSLLHNIFWNSKGDAFAWITYGGYSIITLLFGISICIDSKSRPIYAEKIFLFIGSLMFFGVAGIVLASIDQIPEELVDNAILLGALSFIVGFIFLIDMSEKMVQGGKSDATQTDTSSIDRHFSRNQNIGTVNSELNLIEHDENDMRRSVQNQSMRSTKASSDVMNIQSNPLSHNGHSMNSNQQNRQTNEYPNQKSVTVTQSLDGRNTHHHHHHHSIDDNIHPSYVSEDVVQTKTYPTAQMPTYSKVKHYPTVINHFESEPYKKILNRANNQQVQVPYARYHDQSQSLHENPTFYDDFTKYRQETYYQGPKVDHVVKNDHTSKLMVIRDYSSENHTCNCQMVDNDNEPQDDNATIKSGYVSQVAKLWDDRTKNHQDTVRISQKENISLNTHV